MAMRHQRRWQRGVVASELALALPVLIFVLGGTMTIARMANERIELDTRAGVATRQCALTTAPDGDIAACVQAAFDASDYSGCYQLTVEAAPVDMFFNYGDDERPIVAWKTTVSCKYRLFEIGSDGQEIDLVSTHTVASN